MWICNCGDEKATSLALLHIVVSKAPNLFSFRRVFVPAVVRKTMIFPKTHFVNIILRLTDSYK